jgi:selenocysteine lyase/cysteine desulfurase
VAAAIKAGFEHVWLSHGAAEAARAIALELLARQDAETPRAGAIARVVLIEGLDRSVQSAVLSVARAVGADVDLLATVPRILATDVALVVMPHVDAEGRLHDPALVATTTHRAGARLLVDVSLSVGALPVEVSALGADALVGDVRHWLLGPEGVALGWVTPDLGEDVTPRLRAATGPFARGQLLTLARSVGWLLMHVELPWAVARTGRLARRLHGSLATIDGVEVLTPRTSHSALMALRIAGWDAEQAADELSRSASAITDVGADPDVLRVSVGAWNREDELDRFVERVSQMAAHSPATLPRRPSLTIISSSHVGDG